MDNVKEEVNHTLKSYYEKYAAKQDEDIIAVALYGSQNYNLDLPSSDVDAYMITNINFRDFTFSPRKSKGQSFKQDKGIITKKPVNEYINLLVKHSPNALEGLFTPYIIVNPDYEKQWKELISLRDEIAECNKYSLAGVYLGMAYSRLAKVQYVGFTDKAAKELVMAAFSGEVACRLLNDVSFPEAINASTMRNYDELMDLKINGIPDSSLIQIMKKTEKRLDEVSQMRLHIKNNDFISDSLSDKLISIVLSFLRKQLI